MLTIAFVRDMVRMSRGNNRRRMTSRAASQQLLHQILLCMEVRKSTHPRCIACTVCLTAISPDHIIHLCWFLGSASGPDQHPSYA